MDSYTGAEPGDIPGYVGVLEQARRYVDGGGKFHDAEEAKQWMVRGLLLMVDAMRRHEEILKAFLIGRERDIAAGRNEFGMLAFMFKDLIGREPKE